MAFIVIDPTQVDAKSPVDDQLMGEIKQDLDDLDSRFTGVTAPFTFVLNGRISRIASFRRALDTAPIYKEFEPTFARVSLRKSGISGPLSFDIRRVVQTKTPITGISSQYTDSTQSVSNIAPALATQSITRTTTQISTQSISFAKSSININSIINVGGNKWRYNLASAPDADWLVGKSVTIASATSGANNGTFVLVEVNQSGYPSIVVTNASGVAQVSPAGNAQLLLMSYNFSNPVSSEFFPTESALFAAHTTGANNGTFEIYAINSGGNNILVFNSSGVVQAGVAGNANVQRFSYNFSVAASTTDFVVNEKIKAATHTSGLNNGNFKITAVNNAGNNLQVYNPVGVTQGGVAGTVNTNRWIYALPTDPSTNVTAGDSLYMTGHTNANNDGLFVIKQVNRSATNNVVVYNESGVLQAGVAGNVDHSRKLVQFSSDQSAVYSTLSFIEMAGCPNPVYNFLNTRAPYQVYQVNRGGGSNFNVVIDAPRAAVQASPAGFVLAEMKSVFNSPPSFAVDLTGLTPNQYYKNFSNDFVTGTIPDAAELHFFLLSVPTVSARDLTVTIY